MRFFRVGDKVISREKLFEMVSEILTERERGATQEETANSNGVQRSFVSFLESLGEVRRGPRVALVGFPLANADEVSALAETYAVEFVLLLSQSEREAIEAASAGEVFNRVLDTLAELAEFDVIILLASGWRIATMEKILGREVIPVNLGESPLREDVQADIEELKAILEGVTAPSRRSARREARRTRRGLRTAPASGSDTAGRWKPSKK